MAQVRVKGYTYRRRGKVVAVRPHVRVSLRRRSSRAAFLTRKSGSLSLRHVAKRNRRGGVPKVGSQVKRPTPAPDFAIPKLGGMQIHQIADVIERDWGKQGKGVNYAARPYLDAMRYLGNINENYYADSGRSVVAYFLSNATSWKGPTAKAVKAELKRRLGR